MILITSQWTPICSRQRSENTPILQITGALYSSLVTASVGKDFHLRKGSQELTFPHQAVLFPYVSSVVVLPPPFCGGLHGSMKADSDRGMEAGRGWVKNRPTSNRYRKKQVQVCAHVKKKC